MVKRNIDKVRFLVKNATGLDIMYAYDDLVFPEHGVFIIKMDDENANNFFCYFHEDCTPDDQKNLWDSLIHTCQINQCTLVSEGMFNMTQNGDQIELHFK